MRLITVTAGLRLWTIPIGYSSICRLDQWQDYLSKLCDFGMRICTVEAAREDYGLKVPPPRYTWDDVIAKHNGGMRR